MYVLCDTVRERQTEKGEVEGLGGFVSCIFVCWKCFLLIYATCTNWPAYMNVLVRPGLMVYGRETHAVSEWWGEGSDLPIMRCFLLSVVQKEV